MLRPLLTVNKNQPRGSSTILIYILIITQNSTMHQAPLSSISLTSFTLQYFLNASQLTHYTKDIISGEYEGGFKLWQSTLDMLQFMENIPQCFAMKRVLQIGCGHGLLGILASKLNASHVCLQDYNLEVIEKLTKPTVQLNMESVQKFSFLDGDWQKMKCLGDKFDVIIGSQLIYNQNNYLKLVHIIKQYLQKDGCCILGNKLYYFGVGGNVPAFKKCLQNNALKCQSLLKVIPPMGGNKKQIVKITF